VNRVKEQLRALYSKTRQTVVGLSTRERTMLAGSLAFVFIAIIYSFFGSVASAFEQQTVELKDIETRASTIHTAIERYLKLKSSRDSIEARYREVQFKEGGVLSHLEGILTSTQGVLPGFSIKDLSVRKFGTAYEQLPVTLSFDVSKLDALSSVLNEIVYGKRPLIVGKVDVSRTAMADRLHVSMELSSIREARKTDASR
jgi:hypothetical protein